MRVNMKDLYIGFVGKYLDRVFVNGKAYVDFERLDGYSFFIEKDDQLYDIFTGSSYEPLKANHIPQSRIGVVEPVKYDEFFSDSAIRKIEKNPMFSTNELYQIKYRLNSSTNLNILDAEEVIENRQPEMEM